jgi:hypothetical protein
VDVYINDGRAGSYGSADGQDRFDDMLWKENLGDTPDLGVQRAPLVNPAALGGGPLPHQDPLVNQPAHLYVRVRNRGAAGSGPVTVKAFHSLPGSPRVWPADWTPMPGGSLNVGDVPAAPHAGVGVGPFTWTPTQAGAQSVLVIVECAGDPAITQVLGAGASVPHTDLVPFDNNVAMRDITAV